MLPIVSCSYSEYHFDARVYANTPLGLQPEAAHMSHFAVVVQFWKQLDLTRVSQLYSSACPTSPATFFVEGSIVSSSWRPLGPVRSQRTTDSCHVFLDHKHDGRVAEYYRTKGRERNTTPQRSQRSTRHENFDDSFLIPSASFSEAQPKAYTRQEKVRPIQSVCCSSSWSQS
jgi:hypothetical protein